MINFSILTLPIAEPVIIFCVVLLTILIVPILSEKCRFPSIIGLILAGIVIGPHETRILTEDSTIILFRTIGLLYIMFLAGMDIDLDYFKKRRNQSIIFGLYTFSIPMLIGTFVSYYFLNLNWMSSILLASMFASHTLLAYPTASKLGITQSESVTITIGGTLITDTAALLVLAVIADYAKGNLTPDSWLKIILSLMIFIASVLILLPKIGRWFLKKYETNAGLKFIFVLTALYTISSLSKLAYLEPIIGAFLTGLAFNRLIPKTSPLMNRLQFFGDNFFIPFFLIGVGMLVNLEVITQGPRALKVALTMTIVATACKWIASLLTQKTFHYSTTERNVIFGLSTAQTAATLAAVLVGFNLNIFDENILNGTILMILVTCLISSYVVEHAGRDLAISESNKPPDITKAPERILVPIANPGNIHQLIDLSVMIKDQKSDEPIYPMVVIHDSPDVKTRILESNKNLEEAIQYASATDHSVHVVSRIDKNVTHGILRAIKELMITDVVIGWSGQIHEKGRVFGKIIDDIIAKSDEMVLICRLLEPLPVMKRILVFVPFHPETGSGFLGWARLLQSLSKQLSAPMIFYGNTAALSAVKYENQEALLTDSSIYKPFIHWNNMAVLSKLAGKNDLIVFISGRNINVPNKMEMELLPRELAQHCPANNLLIIYPRIYEEAQT